MNGKRLANHSRGRASRGLLGHWLLVALLACGLAAAGAASAAGPGGVSLLALDGFPAFIAGNGLGNGFREPFTSSLGNWTQNATAVWTVGSGYASVTGTGSNKYANITYNRGTFATLDYSVAMRRSVSAYASNGVYFRGAATPQRIDGSWHSGYWFGYTNSGSFQVGYTDADGNWTSLTGWTASQAILPAGWNRLRVVAVGSSLQFYINGTQVFATTNGLSAAGEVGIEMFDNNGGTLDVDEAVLSTIAPGTARGGSPQAGAVPASSAGKAHSRELQP
jgi:hypothetical protein